jgi:hypothetical protein
VRVRVDREQAAHVGGDPRQPVGRILPFGAAVDLDRDAKAEDGYRYVLWDANRLNTEWISNTSAREAIWFPRQCGGHQVFLG